MVDQWMKSGFDLLNSANIWETVQDEHVVTMDLQ